MIFKPGRVTPVGQTLSADPTQNPIYGVFRRPPIGQVFEADGQRVAVVVNHCKSKSCGDASGVNADQGDGQGCWNTLRVQQAEALLAFIGELQAQSGVQSALVLGDLNAYGEEDPIDALRASGLVDLLAQHVPEGRRYSYVHDAQAGYLDHALAIPALAATVTGATEWHINADEAEALDYRDGNLAELFRPDPTARPTTTGSWSGWRWAMRCRLPMTMPATTRRRWASRDRRCGQRSTASSAATPDTATARSGRSSKRPTRTLPIRTT